MEVLSRGSHSELVVTSDESTNCPSCGTKGWSDSGCQRDSEVAAL